MVTSKSGQLPFTGFNTMRWTKSEDFIIPNVTGHRRGFQKLQSKTNKRKDEVCFPLFFFYQSQLNDSHTCVKSPITSAALHVRSSLWSTDLLVFWTTDVYLLSAFPWISPYISTTPTALRYNLKSESDPEGAVLQTVQSSTWLVHRMAARFVKINRYHISATTKYYHIH